jgi:biopolymer transport protein ExbD
MVKKINRSAWERDSFNLRMVAFIDVIFLLFTFFSLTMRYQIEGELQVKTPKWSGIKHHLTPEQKELEVVKIFLSGRGTKLIIRVQDQLISNFYALYDKLYPLPKDIPVILDAHPSVAYKDVIKAFNTCLKAKLTQIAFAVHPYDSQ